METTDLSGKIKLLIKFGLIAMLATAGAIGYGVFEHYHAFHELRIEDAKVTGTMVSVRTLVNGKVSEFLFEDGAEVKAGDVIARLEISVTDDMIEQLQNTVDLARQNYEDLQRGRWVKVPVKRVRAVQTPIQTSRTVTSGGGGAASLASLEERANRMRELFEMGAISAVQRDAAIQAYENARNNAGSSGSTYTENGISYETTYVEEIEYVDEFQATPPAILYGAENAIKQAELSLNVALQEAQQTEIIATVDGTIYYSTEVEKELSAGDVVAKIGDSKELWLAAEVSEDIFNKVALGKLANYKISGNNLSGIVIEKIKPDPAEEDAANVWQPPTAENDSPQVATDAPPHNDKFILRVSLPEERNFECKPNSKTTLKIRI